MQKPQGIFDSDESRMCGATEFAGPQGAYITQSGNCWWWLRSPGISQSSAASVRADSFLGDYNYVDHGSGAVRLAFWLNLESDLF